MNLFSLAKKLALTLSFSIALQASAQEAHKTKPNWQQLDLKTDSVYGHSTQKANNEPHQLPGIVDGMQSPPVILEADLGQVQR